jgi:serine phosphatase RsbU (regulator of sigma subunit)
MLISEQSRQRLRSIDVLILVALTIAGLIITLQAPTMFLGIRILLGSCFSLTALLLYRSYWGLAVAAPSSLATIWLFGDPFTAIRMLGEMGTISWINQNRDSDHAIRSGRVIRHVAVYAVLLGCPFLYLTETCLKGTPHDVALTLTYKNFINSIFNVLVAYAGYSWIELRRNKRTEGSRHRISLKTLTSVVLMLGCIILSYSLITREFAIASDRGQIMIIERNFSLASLIQRLHLTDPIEQVSDLAELLVNPENEYSPKETSIKEREQNEYDLDLQKGKLVIVRPKDEKEVWYRLKLKGNPDPLEYTPTFFSDVLPKLTEYRDLRLVSTQLIMLTPSRGSSLDKLMSGYWMYSHPDSRYAEPREIQIFTPLDNFVTTLSESSNAALKLLAEVVVIALIVSNVIANRLTNEWIAIIPKRKGDGTVSNLEELYKQSPIAEISSSVDSINERTTEIINAKKQIEYLNAITQRQLNTAAEIQCFFLTKSFPDGLSYEVTGLTRPAYDVGGDWYDAFTINGHSFFVVADVCDKGVGAALFMSVFRTLIRYSTLFVFRDGQNQGAEQSMVNIISDVNQYMSANHGSCMYFATVFFAHINEESSRMNYVSAGHETALLRQNNGEYLRLETTGPALGIFDGATFGSSSAEFNPGEIVLAYSDGVTDARNPQDERYGIERLKAFFGNHDHLTVEQMQENLLDAIDTFMQGAEQFDDITMMFIKRRELGAG